ncbi:hypothetical protein [Salinispira pacifica]|uniref:Uncharacterized protein n=1 Tax=Salinispira pacifica TaxID=1307761 RepID=V5WCM8_9SPIO|nr:hypothetical protein [Salinispira pacifica]AHC13543.1 hypothetical protein L21SP2_0099 [Salinispira pacifica]
MDIRPPFPMLRILLCTVLLSCTALQQQTFGENLPPNETVIREMEFISRPLGEILLSLARFGNIPLLPDPGLDELRSYYFRDIRLDQVLSEILSANSLYLHEKGNIWIASRMRIDISDDRELFTTHAVDVPMESILNRLSELCGIAIRHSSLPAEPQTLHCENRSLADTLATLLLPYPEYRLEKRAGAYVIRNGLRDSRSGHSLPELNVEITGKNPRIYRVWGDGGSARTALEKLFRLQEAEYRFFTQGTHQVSAMDIRSRSFHEALEFLSVQGGLRCIEHQGVFSVFPDPGKQEYPAIQQETLCISSYTPRNRSMEYLKNCIPPSLAAGCSIEPRENGATLIIRGNKEQSIRIADFLAQLDSSYGIEPERIHLDFISLGELKSVLPPALGDALFTAGPTGNGVYALLDPENHEELKEYLHTLDIPPVFHTIHLRHRNAEEIMEHIPAEFASGGIIRGSTPGTIRFKGTPRFAREFRDWVRREDQPRPALEYHILALQVQKSKRRAYSASLGGETLTEQSRHSVSSDLGRVVGLNFDVLTTLGYSFALKLEADLSRSSARIVADSMIAGISRQEARLENTSTYRYRDSSGETAVTREITSGLTISITGEILGSAAEHSKNSAQLMWI